MDKRASVTVRFNDGRTRVVEVGSALMDVVKDAHTVSGLTPLAARLDNTIRSLHATVESDALVEPIDLSSEDGERVYWRSLTVVMARAVRQLRPEADLRVEHSLNHGIYCELVDREGAVLSVTDRDVRSIASAMRELIEADEPFTPLETTASEAARLLRQHGHADKADLIASGLKPSAKVRLFQYGGDVDCYYGDLVPSTGYLKQFSLRYYLPGMILLYPRRYDPHHLPKFEEQRKLSRVFYRSSVLGRTMGVTDIRSLNRAIEEGRICDLVALNEAVHERDIARIADEIAANRDQIGLVLIAGPSSSGKTTFAQRLSLHLRLNGIAPHPISMDDYFVERSQTPKDESGQPDFESIYAIDLDLFNEQLSRLMTGDEVSLPTFNFQTGEREYRGRKLRLTENSLLVVEGIHGLNDELTSAIPRERKYRIYVSALTQLNVDVNTRIQTTDTRLIRRIVRDSVSRGHSASRTLELWDAVRRGEQRNIFPYQEQADVMFDSALAYELAVLRPLIEPLLKAIPREDRGYAQAERLLSFIQLVRPMTDTSSIPPTSILREFVGGSCFAV
ncbi:MAG: nucleoside kinase [Bacillota bacterium]|nr:nucleoside kinase [Bacillota bacterium]HPZ55171.1 nucleoside kinase [Bacillota bacterium]HQD18456.1 nucleoside kinase [Bacillota bacterium]